MFALWSLPPVCCSPLSPLCVIRFWTCWTPCCTNRIGSRRKLSFSSKAGSDCGALAIQLEAGTETAKPSAPITLNRTTISISAATIFGMRSRRFNKRIAGPSTSVRTSASTKGRMIAAAKNRV